MKVRFRFKDGIYGEVKDIEFAIESMTQDNWREEQKAIEHRIESLSRTNGLEEEVKHLYFILKKKVNSFNVKKIEDVLTVADEKVLTSVEELNDVVNIRKSGLGFEDYQYSTSPQGNTIVWEGDEEVLVIAPLSDELKDELRYDGLWKGVDVEDANEEILREQDSEGEYLVVFGDNNPLEYELVELELMFDKHQLSKLLEGGEIEYEDEYGEWHNVFIHAFPEDKLGDSKLEDNSEDDWTLDYISISDLDIDADVYAQARACDVRITFIDKEQAYRLEGHRDDIDYFLDVVTSKLKGDVGSKLGDGGADVEVEKIIKEALREIGQANSIKHFTTRGRGYTIDFVDFTLSDKGRFFKIVEPKLGELGWDIGDFGRFANMAKRPTSDSFIEDADEMELTEEELKELFLQFDLSGINEALSERLGFEVNLKAYVEEKPRVNRYSLYDETDHSKDTSFTDMLFTKLTIGTFSGGWSKVNSYFWFGIDIFYSVHGGGSNGVKFAELEIYPDGEYNLTFNKDKYK